MTTTRQGWIDQAISIATRASKSGFGMMLNSEMVAEDLLQNIALEVGIELSATRNGRGLLRGGSTITFTSGNGILPVNALTQFSHESNLFDPTTNLTSQKRYSYEPNWQEFIRSTDRRIGYYIIQGLAISIIEPNATYNPNSGLNGDRLIQMPLTPVVPTGPAGVIASNDQVVNRLVMRLADALIGAPVPEAA